MLASLKVSKALKRYAGVLAAVLAVVAVCYAYQQIQQRQVNARLPDTAAKQFTTTHYAITSTASEAETGVVAQAVESLHAAYGELFAQSISADPDRKKLLLTLYKNQSEFKMHNKSAFWAEAYYLQPVCYAYYAGEEKNPYHWMLHEATHQLNSEVARFPNSKWINEGLATYFGTSAILAGKLTPGVIDVHTYPIWGVKRLTLSGNLNEDIERGKVIGLQALVSGVGGPNIDEKVNTYYIGYWSLTHFLFHFDSGRYAGKYRELIAAGGSIENFERIVGPIDRIQGEWYIYLQQQVAQTKGKK